MALAGVMGFFIARAALHKVDVAVSLGADVVVVLALLAKVYLGLGGLLNGLLLLGLFGQDARTAGSTRSTVVRVR